MLHGKRLTGLTGRLVQCLVADTVLSLISVTTIGTGHRQGLAEYGLTALLVAAYEMAHVEYQHRAAAKQLRALDLAKAVAVDGGRAAAATGTYGAPACRMGSERHKGFITRHIIQRNVPGKTFFFHT